jgi:hypothetical protein
MQVTRKIVAAAAVATVATLGLATAASAIDQLQTCA